MLSGINHGGNLGADVHYSGTVAAVREAVLHGWPGVALSHYRREKMEFDWQRAASWVARVLRELTRRPTKPGLFYNVNLPHLRPSEDEPEIVFCALDPHPLPLSYRHEEGGGLFYDGVYHSREAHAWCRRRRLFRRTYRRNRDTAVLSRFYATSKCSTLEFLCFVAAVSESELYKCWLHPALA